jgi:hypothetical protein
MVASWNSKAVSTGGRYPELGALIMLAGL